MAQKKKTTHTSGVKKAAVMTGIAATAAAAIAGAYFLYGTKEGKQAQKKIKGWMIKAKGEVIEKMENLKEVNEEAYHKVVDAVTAKYNGIKTIDPKEVSLLVKELKGHWIRIKKEIEAGKKTVAKAGKKSK